MHIDDFAPPPLPQLVLFQDSDTNWYLQPGLAIRRIPGPGPGCSTALDKYLILLLGNASPRLPVTVPVGNIVFTEQQPANAWPQPHDLPLSAEDVRSFMLSSSTLRQIKKHPLMSWIEFLDDPPEEPELQEVLKPKWTRGEIVGCDSDAGLVVCVPQVNRTYEALVPLSRIRLRLSDTDTRLLSDLGLEPESTTAPAGSQSVPGGRKLEIWRYEGLRTDEPSIRRIPAGAEWVSVVPGPRTGSPRSATYAVLAAVDPGQSPVTYRFYFKSANDGVPVPPGFARVGDLSGPDRTGFVIAIQEPG